MTVRQLRSYLLAPTFVLSLGAEPAAAQTPSCSDLAKDYWFRFTSGTIVHTAHLRMVGCTGRMFVRFLDATRNQEVTISQVMQLRSSEGTWVEGSNPVDSATGVANATYRPDKLLFQMIGNGRPGIGNCDQPNACSEVLQATRLAVSNTCSDPIAFAVVYADPAEGDALVRAGWWTVQPHQTVETPIQTFADSFYIRGQTMSRTWAGPDSFVVTPDAQFRARVNQLVLSRANRRIGFRKVVLADKVQRYVQQFECRPRSR